MSEKLQSKVEFILEMIDNIHYVVHKHKKISLALEDIEGEAAVLMFLMQIGETLNKAYKLDQELVLQYVDLEDIQGAYSVRNYIAHDYEGVDLAFVEEIVRTRIPHLQKGMKNFLEFLRN